MEFVVKASELADAIQQVKRANLSARPTLPILNCIKLTAEDGGLLLEATDLMGYAQRKIDANVTGSGSVAVDAKMFHALVSSLDGNTFVTFKSPDELDGWGRATVSFGKSEYKLPVLPADEYPVPPENLEEGVSFEISSDLLSEVLRKVDFAVSKDSTMGVFTGVHFSVFENSLWVVATDTHRMSVKKLELSEEVSEFAVTLPAKHLRALLAAIKGKSILFQVTRDGTLVKFTCGDDLKFLLTALNGSFPNFRRVIPSKSIVTVNFDVGETSQVLKRMSVFKSQGRKAPLRVVFTVSKTGEVSIGAWDIEYGALEEVGKETLRFAEVQEWSEIPQQGSESVAGDVSDTYQIAFNRDYLLEYFTLARSGTVTCKFQSPNQAALLQHKDDKDWLYVVMPMHLPGIE